MIFRWKSKGDILLFCLAIMLFTAFDVLGEAQIAIIANKDVPADHLTPEAIKKIFLGDTTNWNANEGIIVVLSKDETVQGAFIKQYIKRTPYQFENVWRRNLFTGKGARSIRISNMEDLIQFVATTKGAIGYVPADTNLPSNVKIIGKE
ncbi:MAG: substrate-binding domain-containing protein [Proteobacteria bacterium]|nr:substrate-binding domain-containing protein [Pseudomonadota bacterium]